MKKKSPAFQWYSKDILSSARVALMTLEEEGAYRRALDFCWLNGTLPNDPALLARVIGKGCSVEVAKVVQQMFIVDKKNPQNLLHERLEVERKKQKNFRQKKSKAGIASGQSRRKSKKEKQISDEHLLNTCSDSVRTEVGTKTNSSFAVASSSSSSDSAAAARESFKKNSSAAAAVVEGECEGELTASGDGDVTPAVIAELQAKPAYKNLNVQNVADKLAVRCEIERVKPTRRRLILWLNREFPKNGNGNGKPVEDVDDFIRNYKP